VCDENSKAAIFRLHRARTELPCLPLTRTGFSGPRDAINRALSLIIPALSLGGAKKWWDVKALHKFGVAHCGLSHSSIREIFDQVTTAVGETIPDIRRYANDYPAFSETAGKMLPAWEAGLQGIGKTLDFKT